MKDFAAEIRAHLDVEHFLSQAQLLLDIQETNVEKILENMLHHLLDGDEPHGVAFNEAKKVLFTHDSGLYHFLHCSNSMIVM
jgi:solute carrier family 4 (sodium borate transporter), member 11